MINWLKPKKDPDDVLKELNEKETNNPWTYGPGYHALLRAEFQNNNTEIKFDLSAGAVVKSFVNRETGELRTYVINHLTIPERPLDR